MWYAAVYRRQLMLPGFGFKSSILPNELIDEAEDYPYSQFNTNVGPYLPGMDPDDSDMTANTNADRDEDQNMNEFALVILC